RATPAAFVERQLEPTQQIFHLLPYRRMARIRASADHYVVEIIKRGQSLREKLAIRRALNETVDCAKAQLRRQFAQALSDEMLVARSQHRETVSHHDPVGCSTVKLAALASCIPHQLRIVAQAGHGAGRGINRAKHV